MTALNDYLADRFLTAAQVAAAADMAIDELDLLICEGLVPAASYVVADTGTLGSFVFGAMAAPGATPGRYFPPSQTVWIARAHEAVLRYGLHGAQARLKEQFGHRFAAALAALNLAVWRLPDCFGENGAPLEAGLRVRVDNAWSYFLSGTFGMCVVNPVSEAHIAYKEVLQEKLVQLSENGARRQFSAQQAQALLALIDQYAAAAMPFSPVEYTRSSRKRLVDDLRATLHAAHPLAARTGLGQGAAALA